MFTGKKLIIFDLDGTLIDSINIWNQIDVELVRRISGLEIDFEDIRSMRDDIMANTKDGEDKYLKYFEALIKKYNSNLTPEEVDKLNDDVALDMLRTFIDYKSDAESLIKYLKDNNYTLVIATTSPNYMVDIYINENINIINKANISEYFDSVYTKDSVTNLKPNPEVYLKVLSDYGISADDAIALEDSIEGVKAAVGAGLEVIAMYDENSNSYREEINATSTYQFNSFTELLKELGVSKKIDY